MQGACGSMNIWSPLPTAVQGHHEATEFVWLEDFCIFHLDSSGELIHLISRISLICVSRDIVNTLYIIIDCEGFVIWIHIIPCKTRCNRMERTEKYQTIMICLYADGSTQAEELPGVSKV